VATGRPQAAALAAAFLLPAAAAAQAPACEPGDSGARRADSTRYAVLYRASPAPQVAKHFSLDVVVCAKAQAPAPDALRVTATMPEHGHGMNYTASIQSLGAGRYRAEGLMFHMRGRWQLVFEVGRGAAAESVLDDFVLR
jgi:hypothetical protein